MQRILVALILLLSFNIALAEPTTPQQAEAVVKGWLRTGKTPLGATISREIAQVSTYRDGDGVTIYYVVSLDPQGFVVVPADDRVEPVIAFVPQGTYDPSQSNPLGALVSRDLAGRIAQVRDAQAKALAPGDASASAQEKWDTLVSIGSGYLKPAQKATLTADEQWVPALVQSKWNQLTVAGQACYNYYTPPGVPDSADNYPCGCVATAMAQVMRFYEYPTAGVGTTTYIIKVDDVDKARDLRGGDGAGGPYDWDAMPLVPDATILDEERQAIGALCHDAGVAALMSYKEDESAAFLYNAVVALVFDFGFSKAIYGANSGNNIGAGLNGMINPNLDSGRPVLLGIATDTPGVGHAIVCDGYGYNLETLYHHLNMGWSGLDDTWYELPGIETSEAMEATFTSVVDCVYNIFKTGTGEIISGRVTDSLGNPVSGAVVTADAGGQPYEATTNSMGIYALSVLPSATTYTVSVTEEGYTFVDKTVTTGTSAHLANVSGNKWGINFENDFPNVAQIPEIQKAQVGPGDGYLDVEWIYPAEEGSYDGIIVAYGTEVFPTLEVTDEGELAVVDGRTVYKGRGETSKTVTLSNGTTALFCMWAYGGTQTSDAVYAAGTPAEGADGITDRESFYGSGSGGGGGGCFLSTAFAGEDGTSADKKRTRAANRKRIHQARIKFLELYRKAKKPKEGPGRIVGFVVDRGDYCAIKGTAVKATLVPEKKEDKTKAEPESRKTLSGKEGVYEIEGLKPGRYTVEAAAEDYDPYKKDNIFVKPGIGPGLGRWLVIEMKKRVAQKGGLLGELKFIEPTFKHIKVLVTKAADGWDDIKDKEIILFSGTNESVVKSMKSLTVGDTVECHFVRRGGRYNLIDVAKEEE